MVTSRIWRAGLLWSQRSDELPPPDAEHGGSL
jgi:hypothetical protein